MRLTGLLVIAGVVAAGCGDDVASAPADAALVNGCPSLVAPVAQPGDDLDGDTWSTFAMEFFATHCTRCHASTLTGAARGGAPEGYDWDVEASVREHLAMIRHQVGVANSMPFLPPDPTCAERERLVRWIDADAP